MSENESSLKTGIKKIKIQNNENLYGMEMYTIYETKADT